MFAQTQPAGVVSRPADVLAALHRASADTGSDFAYLLGTAMRESSLKTQVKSATSSATGLFQFIDQTWLGLIKRFGASHGLGQYSDAIHQTENGHYAVASAETKSAILALRKDPSVAALMAGEAAGEAKAGMEQTLGRPVSCGELYAAHFLGQGSACRLIALNASNPNQAADLAFPEAAKANRSVFYNLDGTAKTVGEIYDWAVRLPNGAHGPRFTPSSGSSGPSTASAVGAFDIAGDFASANVKHFWRASPPAGADQPAETMPELRSFFPVTARATATGGLPQAAGLALTPDVIEILASLNAGTAFATPRRAT